VVGGKVSERPIPLHVRKRGEGKGGDYRDVVGKLSPTSERERGDTREKKTLFDGWFL